MPYTDELKIITATRLKQLRKSKLDKKGKPFSCKTLKCDIEKMFPAIQISDKSLSYYEVQSPENSKFYIGKGMKVENLVLLADYYGVTTDYLLGRENTDITSIIEASAKMGLDEETTRIMLELMELRVQNRELVCTINNLIHSVSINEPGDSNEVSSDISFCKPDKSYISIGFLKMLTRYLYFSCDPQYISKYSKSEDFRQLELTEDEVANLILMSLQIILQKSRDNHKLLRDAPEKKLNRMLKRRKGKK